MENINTTINSITALKFEGFFIPSLTHSYAKLFTLFFSGPKKMKNFFSSGKIYLEEKVLGKKFSVWVRYKLTIRRGASIPDQKSLINNN